MLLDSMMDNDPTLAVRMQEEQRIQIGPGGGGIPKARAKPKPKVKTLAPWQRREMALQALMYRPFPQANLWRMYEHIYGYMQNITTDMP